VPDDRVGVILWPGGHRIHLVPDTSDLGTRLMKSRSEEEKKGGEEKDKDSWMVDRDSEIIE
jgi:hypothetical protein